MRRISLWLFSTVAAVVLLFSYRTSTNTPAQTTAAPVTTTTTTTTPTTAAEPDPTSTGSSAETGSKTYTGTVASTRWGDVQVTITVTDGKITDVGVPVYPQENHKDQEINAYALPVLKQETLAAQSADIDTVSGATVTSEGYLESLQSALDAAHLS
ncbi:FMN-binding protein [Actinoplanes sp. NPDC049599]|uniref:FMN-binding protein n=1 Tax=Actinoplanes sp. NPDC049599 TaxID=3363903 RepID=UPI0037A2BC7C